jgi:hypothetical protein
MQEHFPDGFIQRRRNSKFKKKQEDGEPVDADGEDGSVPFGSVHHHALHHVHPSTAQSSSHHQQHQNMDMRDHDQHGPASASRKLEEAQAEAARAIIMNMALQAQMASVNYRQHPSQTSQQHSRQQDHHQLHPSSHHTHADVGEGSSTGMHTVSSSAASAAAAAAAAGLMQSLTTGENADDPSIRALREEAMRQVAQMEGYRTDYVVDADEDETFEQDEAGLSMEQDGAGIMTDHVGRSGEGTADGEGLQAEDYDQGGQQGYHVGDYTDGTTGQMKAVGLDDEENVDPTLSQQKVQGY